MARGSGGGGGGGASAFQSYEMLQSGGQVDNSGKYTVSRKYYVTQETDLVSTPLSIEVGGKSMKPSALSYQKIGPSVWEKTIEYTAPLTSSETGVVRKLSTTGSGGEEGRLQMEVSSKLEDISRHPEIEFLKEKYAGKTENGKVIFPETYTEQGTGTSGGTPKKNPFFGVRFFYTPSATVRHTYTVDQMPANIWAGVFCIVETGKLPGGFPPFPEYTNKKGVTMKHHWQIQMPQIALVGGRIEITNTYTLLPLMTPEAAQDYNKISPK
jgi:hypothetical protein